MPRYRLFSFGLAGLLVASGCGSNDGLPRQQVSGKVTFDGKPLESGSLTFLPVDESQGTSAGAVIQGGDYSIPRDQGPTPGRFKVMIFTTSGGVEAPTDEPPGEVTVVKKKAMVLPVRYNHQTELTAEVKDGGPNVFNFDMTSK